MKMFKFVAAAGLALATVVSIAPAQAQSRHDRGDRHEQRYERHDRNDRHNRWDRGHNRGWDHNRSYRGRHHRNCWSEWRHHRRVTICR
jgi:Ni/Co efflux regulator RcnB